MLKRVSPQDVLKFVALEALAGVGDHAAGQWEEYSGYAFHLKRRLTIEEQAVTGEAVDIRGTPEQDRRWLAVRKFLPAGFKNYRD